MNWGDTLDRYRSAERARESLIGIQQRLRQIMVDEAKLEMK
jgi:hypothetical protein